MSDAGFHALPEAFSPFLRSGKKLRNAVIVPGKRALPLTEQIALVVHRRKHLGERVGEHGLFPVRSALQPGGKDPVRFLRLHRAFRGDLALLLQEGEKPFSEPETAALKDFTLEVRPSATISYHTKGRVVYYDFGLDPVRKKYFRRLAVKTARTLGYKVVDGDCGSAGGYKDWCEYKLGIAAFTVEMGDDKLRHPLSEEDITEDCERSALLPLQLEKWMRLTKK